MKKLFILLMACVLVLTLVACGGGDTETTTSAPETTTGEDATTTTPTTTTKPVETTTEPVATTTEATTTEAPVADNYNVEDYKAALSVKKPEAKVPAASYTVWDGSVAAAFAGGTGTKDDPYLISNGAELAYLAQLVNGTPYVVNPDATNGELMEGENPSFHVYYKLTQDIYLNNVSDISAWSNDPASVPDGVNVWTPIGLASDNMADGESRYFKGYFDGAGFTIYGMYTTPDMCRAGLFGRITGLPTGTNSDATTNLSDLVALGLDGLMEYANVQNLTISHSMVSGYGYIGAISGMIIDAAVVNCVIDETVTVVQVGSDDGADGSASFAGRFEGYLKDCVSAATITAQPVLVDKGDGKYNWNYADYQAGMTAVSCGVFENCGFFGDVYVVKQGGLFACFFGNSNGAARVTGCYAEGTLYDGWLGVDTSLCDRKNLTIVGLFAAQTCRQDSNFEYIVGYCVSAGKFGEGFSFDNANKIGVIAGEHGQWTPVKNILYVNTGYPDTLLLSNDWDTKASLLWENIYEVTPEQMAEYRATYAK